MIGAFGAYMNKCAAEQQAKAQRDAFRKAYYFGNVELSGRTLSVTSGGTVHSVVLPSDATRVFYKGIEVWRRA